MYIIPSDPIPLARARISCISKSLRVWDEQKQLKLWCQITLKNQLSPQFKFYTHPLHLNVTFYLKIPLKGKYMKKFKPNTPHAFIPDLDNLIKFICDICTTIFYKNDSIVSSISARKIYSNNPRTEFYFERYEENTQTR